MKKTLVFLSLFFTFFGSAHEYYFAFAEVEYDEMNGRIEVTLTVSTHDFEYFLQQKRIIQGDLNKNKSDSLKFQLIEDEIVKHFSLKEFQSTLNKSSLSEMRLDGFETSLTGTVEFYLSLDVYQPLETIEIVFDVLMDQHPNQQNKLYFITRDKKRTFDFLNSKKVQIVELN